MQALTGLRTLYLESNAICAIQGLDALTGLRSLYLGRNLISAVQGLERLALLETLDLSENRITRLQASGGRPGTRALPRPPGACQNLCELALALHIRRQLAQPPATAAAGPAGDAQPTHAAPGRQ
jgi:Leucine-rich repeat (LRR) protein